MKRKSYSPQWAGLAILLIGCFYVAAASQSIEQAHTGWSDYGGAADSAQYSALTQINKSNVNKLQVAWTYSTGDTRKYFFDPLMAHGLLYVLAKNNSIVALDAASGTEVWVHATDAKGKLLTNRGNQLLGERGWDRTAGCFSRATIFCKLSMLEAGRPFRRLARTVASICGQVSAAIRIRLRWFNPRRRGASFRIC